MMKPSDVSPLVRQYLEDACSFVLDADPSALSMLPSSNEHTLIGGDGMGGAFFEWNAEHSGNGCAIVYLSEYGETSRFADSFLDAIRIVTSFPEVWGEALVAAHKSRELFDRVALACDADLDDEAQDARRQIVTSLGLDLAGVAEAFFLAVRRNPPFAPLLQTDDGPTEALSFGDRPYPV